MNTSRNSVVPKKKKKEQFFNFFIFIPIQAFQAIHPPQHNKRPNKRFLFSMEGPHKVLILGEVGAGKTSVVRRYMHGYYLIFFITSLLQCEQLLV